MGQARESGAARWAAGGRPRLMTVGDDGGSELPENAPSGVMKGAQLGRLWNSARLERRMHPICWLQRHDRLTTASLPHRPCAASILLKILLIKASRVGSPCWLNPPGVRGCRLAAAASSRPRLRGGRRRGPPVRVQFRESRPLVQDRSCAGARPRETGRNLSRNWPKSESGAARRAAGGGEGA